MAAQLRRGIAHYQSGEEDVPRPTPITRLQDVKAGQGALIAPAALAAPSGSIGNILTGQYGNVLADPDASALAQHLARSAQADVAAAQVAQTNERAKNLAVGPSPVEKLVRGVFGTQADWESIKNRDAAAKALGHPLVQQHLVNNPDHLTRAENDPYGYVRSPEFSGVLQRTMQADAEVRNHPKVKPEEQQKVAADMVNHNVTADQAAAAMNPRRYTRDEFIKTFENIPTDTFMQLFGAKLQHVPSSQEKAATEYIDRLHGEHLEATKKVNQMLEADAKAEAEKKPRIYGREPLWGQSELAKAQAERATKLQILLDALASHAGIAQKQIQVPPKG
jgi:hypothetical protein